MTEFIRHNDRANDALRDIQFELNYVHTAYGSVLARCGNTRVLCTVSVEDRVPQFLENSGFGWLTAEYSMLPGSTSVRISRDRALHSGRSHEIQRLIGRSLRCCLDRQILGMRTLLVDCDVIEADGGTRTTAINGGYVALELAISRLMKEGRLEKNPLVRNVSGVSLGMVNGEWMLDLDYREDSRAEVDANVVGSSEGELVEFQSTAEQGMFKGEDLMQMYALAFKGIREISEKQKLALSEVK